MNADPDVRSDPAGGPAGAAQLRDLGFGSSLLDRERSRLLNRDGTFSVVRLGLPWWKSINLYHSLVTCSWWTFYGLLAGGYLGVNLVFALGYLACGPDALAGAVSTSPEGRFFDAFFFSVQTLATIGYGAVSPRGLAANAMVAVEALLGMLGVALATGISFARLSRPRARIRFAEKAVVAPYRDGAGFMFRVANESSSQLLEVEATVVLSHLVAGPAGKKERRFAPLALERARVMFFPLHWTVVHPIEPGSPFFGLDAEELSRADAEVFILMTAFDEATSQTVRTRMSYKAEEIAFGVRYADIFVESRGTPTIDMALLSAIRPA